VFLHTQRSSNQVLFSALVSQLPAAITHHQLMTTLLQTAFSQTNANILRTGTTVWYLDKWALGISAGPSLTTVLLQQALQMHRNHTMCHKYEITHL